MTKTFQEVLEDRHYSTREITQYFEYEHLPPHLQALSKACADLAEAMVNQLPDSPELTTGLRKLLEGKDCFVRCAVTASKKRAPKHPSPASTSTPPAPGWDVWTKPFTKDNLPTHGWTLWEKTGVTEMLRVHGKFSVETSEGLTHCENGWLAKDAEGNPYPIAASVQSESYVPVHGMVEDGNKQTD